MIFENKTKVVLDEQQIEKTVKLVIEILSGFKMDRKNLLRIRLMLEELLLKILKSNNTKRNCNVLFRRRFSNGILQLTYDGLPYNPLDAQEMSSRQN